MQRRTDTSQATGALKYLFVQSHGLRSPLTAIRWACGRLLRGKEPSLAPAQQKLVQHIYDNARKLTVALESMLVLAKIEDKLLTNKATDICLRGLISLAAERAGVGGNIRWSIDSPHVHVTAHNDVIEAMLKDILAVFTESIDTEQRTVFVSVDAHENGLVVVFRSSFLFPVLHAPSGGSAEGGEAVRLVGGVQGLMLSMANELARYEGGTVELEEVITGEFIADGTVEVDAGSADEHRITLRLRLKPSIVEGQCGGRR